MKKSLLQPLSYVFGISIILAFVVYYLGIYYPETFSGPKGLMMRFPLGLAYMWVPGVVALIFARKEKIFLPILQRINRFFIYAALIPVALTLVTIIVSLAFGRFDPTFLDGFYNLFQVDSLMQLSYWIKFLLFVVFLFFMSIVSGITLNLLFSLGEELMWRGYLLEKMRHLGLWRASLYIGLIWGLWHAPIIILWKHNYASFPILGPIWMIAFTLLLTPIMIFLREKGKSILVPAIFHGVLNAFAYLSFVTFPSSSIMLVGMFGLSGFFVMGVMNVILFYHLKKNPNTLGSLR